MKISKIKITLVFVFCSFYFQSLEAAKRRHKYGKIIKYVKIKDKKDKIATKDGDSKSDVLSKKELQSLENKFETIKDLGSIFKCRIHNSETLIDGDHFICNGKRFKITPEAAKDIEMPGSARQSIMQSPEGIPQDLFTTFHAGGIYGQPVASFLNEPYGLRSSAVIEPHDKYPMMGIFDHGLRSLDPEMTGRKKVVQMSTNSNNKLTSPYDDLSFWQRRSMPSLETGRSFSSFDSANEGGMELGEITQTLNALYDDNDMKQFDDYGEDNDNFYRDSRMQMDAFGMNGVNKISSNPFAQYWRSLQNSFYGTTASLLGERDPSANSHGRIYEKGELRTKIPTKKSNIQKGANESGKKRSLSIPKPEISRKPLVAKKQTHNATGEKRYMIYGGQQFPMQYYRNPSYNSIQYFAGQQSPFVGQQGPFVGQQSPFVGQQRPFTRTFTSYNNYAFRDFNQYRPNFNLASQQGFTRSLGSPYNQQWGFHAETPNYYDPYLEGGVSRDPLSRGFAQMQSQLVAGSPGHPRVGVMQYGIQPHNKRPPFLGYVPVPIMQPMPMNFERGGMSYETSFEPHSPEETLEQASDRSTMSRDADASSEYEKLTDPQSYLPAPFYRPPFYNPHESEDFFPDGTNQKHKEDENRYLQGNDYEEGFQKTHGSNGGNAAELYEDEMQQEQNEDIIEQAKKRASQPETHLNIHGNKIDTGPDGKLVFEKDHVGFGPITVEAKTANSAMKDPTDDDDE